MKYSKIVILVAGVVLAAGGFAHFFWPDIEKYLQMRRQKQYLAERIAEEEDKGVHLKREQEALAQDPVQIEKVGREKLGLSRPHEIIYKFEENPVSQQSVTAQVPKNQEKSKN